MTTKYNAIKYPYRGPKGPRKMLGELCHHFNIPLKLEELYRKKYDLPMGRSSKAERARHTTQDLFGGQDDE